MLSDLPSPASDSALDFPRLCQFLSERSPQPMVAVEGVAHIIRYVNPAFCTLADMLKDELIGLPFCEAVPEGEHNGCEPLLERVYRTGEAELLAEQEHQQTPVGSWSYSVWAILGPDEQPAGVMIQITDSADVAIFRQRAKEINQSLVLSSMRQHLMTENSDKMNKELSAATEAKNQFIATMSHEIRTPLNAIMGFSDLLSLPNQTEHDRRIFSGRMKRNASLLLRLINDILDLSKVESGKIDIEKIEVNLPELLSDVCLVMRHLAEEKGLTLTIVAASPLPVTIMSDPTRLKQILTNIIGNAVKFTATGAVSVTVEVDHVDKRLRVMVSDTGNGIDPAEALKLFKPFVQGDATITRKYGGTGLGLDLARRLANALGGDVVLVQSAPGIGSVFEITLALEGAKYMALPIEASATKKGAQVRLDDVNVLLAEDAPDNQLLVSAYLTMVGATVAFANNGEEAVAMAVAGDFDIVLMDIQMPKLDGYAATAQLRSLGYKGPIVALTAFAMRDEIERCRHAGCDGHLAKPVGRKELWETIKRMININAETLPYLRSRPPILSLPRQGALN